VRVDRFAFLIVCLCLFRATALAIGDTGKDRPVDDTAVKATLLARMPSLVEWGKGKGPGAAEPVRLGILGNPSFGDKIDSEGEKLTKQYRRFVVVHRKEASELLDCHIVFVGRDRKESLAAITNILQNHSILLVGEESGFANVGAGGMINMIVKTENVVLQVNPSEAVSKGLRLKEAFLQNPKIEVIGPPAR
jgi:YfiR/HmsC-like